MTTLPCNPDSQDCLSHHHRHPAHPCNLSRLSMCSTTPTFCADQHDNQDDGVATCYSDTDQDPENVQNTNTTIMSRLSIQSLDNDADGELSDHKQRSCLSLPGTPPRSRKNVCAAGLWNLNPVGAKEYASESELADHRNNSRRRRRKRKAHTHMHGRNDQKNNYSSGESEGSSGGVVVITKPKGGKRALRMGLDEVKACRDLGFELEVEHTSIDFDFDFDGEGSSKSRSSGESSPVSPRDIKARLKLWAQAVALASASPRHAPPI